MTENEALKYAQAIWGDGQWNARIKRVGRKYQVGRHMSKSSWILGEGSSWEEAFRTYFVESLRQHNAMIANGFHYPEHQEALDNYAKIQQAINVNKLPEMETTQ